MIHKIETNSGSIYLELPNVSIYFDSIKRIVPVVCINGRYVEVVRETNSIDHE